MGVKLKDFLKQYDTVIFDMDGVITGEYAYWDAAGLTVYQQINAESLFCDEVDVEYYMKNVKKIRNEVFAGDKIIAVLKNKGVNSNWDLSYVVFAIAKILDTKDFNKVLRYAEEMSGDIFSEYERIAKRLKKVLGVEASRTSELWNTLKMRFQEWVLGDRIFKKVYGYEPSQGNKPGLLKGEEPVVNGEKLKKIIKALYDDGKRLCTATGRIWEELEPPLKRFGIYDFRTASKANELRNSTNE